MPMLKPEKTNAWGREAHRARALRALPKMLDFESSTLVLPTRPPVPEQDVRDVARSQRNRAQVFSQREVLAALVSADVALESKETAVDRASRWLRELMGAGR